MNKGINWAQLSHSKLLILTLITVFLSMQWSSSHIHLAEQHTHQQNPHLHKLEAHAHHLSLTEQHSDSIDDSRQNDHSNVIDINQEICSHKKSQKKISDIFLLARVFQLPLWPFPTSLEISSIENVKLSRHEHTSVRPRAPPINT